MLENYEQAGIMPRSFDYIFKRIDDLRQEAETDHNNIEFLVKSSYLEIYNEQILDLLDPNSMNLSL
jgi:kinesin family protein 15